MHNNPVISSFKPVKHKHQACLHSAIVAAKKHCDNLGLRLTPIRQRVLELVWKNHEPVKAYDILDALKQFHAASAPPTVYRALDFLQEEGLVHKIESLNAYIGCGAPDQHHTSQFLICRLCGATAELNDTDIRSLISDKASDLGFKIDQEIIEMKGICSTCSDEPN